jgi:hypothetical protein
MSGYPRSAYAGGPFAALLALLETRPVPGLPENLYSAGQLRRVVGHLGREWAGPAPTMDDVEPCQELRDSLAQGVFATGPGEAGRALEAAVRCFGIMPALRPGGSFGFRAYASEEFNAHLAAVLVPAAMDLHSGGMVHRLRECRAPRCGAGFLDTTSDGRRLYCSARCRSCAHMRKTRARAATGG